MNLNNETLVKNLNETCSWMVQSPTVTTIVLRVSSLLLKDPRDSVLVLEGDTLLASYTNIDQSGKYKFDIWVNIVKQVCML